MRKLYIALTVILLVPVIGVVRAQNAKTNYQPGDFQTANPNYPRPNPFYFEGKIDWDLLKISQPSNAWEYLQEGIHKQDDLGDIPGAILDYQTGLSMNSLQNGTCQIVTSATLVNGVLPSQLTPRPCIFTLRLRLGHLLQETDPVQAILLFKEVLKIDSLKIGVNSLIGKAYVIEAREAKDATARQQAYQHAIEAFQAELALSPVTPKSIALTGDEANNAHVHWELADIYETLGQNANAVNEYQQYLLATRWHSDVYPWRIKLVTKKIQVLRAGMPLGH